MPIPTDISQLSTTVGLNSPLGTDSPTVLDDIQRAHAAFIRQTSDRVDALAADGAVTAAKLATNAVTAVKLDSTAVIKVLQAAYPVGSIYINAGSTVNPSTLLGFGTWVAFGAGRVMVGQNTSDTSFDVMEETGGSKDAVVVAHTHSITDPGHSHSVDLGLDVASGTGFQKLLPGSGFVEATTSTTTGISVNSAGVSGTNANLQPYIVVKMWKRTV